MLRPLFEAPFVDPGPSVFSKTLASSMPYDAYECDGKPGRIGIVIGDLCPFDQNPTDSGKIELAARSEPAEKPRLRKIGDVGRLVAQQVQSAIDWLSWPPYWRSAGRTFAPTADASARLGRSSSRTVLLGFTFGHDRLELRVNCTTGLRELSLASRLLVAPSLRKVRPSGTVTARGLGPCWRSPKASLQSVKADE